jgi:integrase
MARPLTRAATPWRAGTRRRSPLRRRRRVDNDSGVPVNGAEDARPRGESLNAAIDAWRLVLAYGCDRRELAHNAAAAMKKVARDHAEMQTYTPAEIRTVLRAADKDRNGHLWYLALSGLRRGEIAGLMWSDVDFDAGTITVARSRVELGGGPTTVLENEPKTKASRRTLPLDEGLLAVLRRASARYAQEKLALGAAHADSGYVACAEAANRTRRAR